MEIGKEILRGFIEIIVLNFLKTTKRYGYDLIKLIGKKTNGKFSIKEATMYLALRRLETNGFLISYWDSSDNNGGRRRFYEITPEGIGYYMKKKEEWVFIRDIMNELLEGEIDG
ncbi:PadR family transcriptional regulator [Cohnella sp. LGH]|uniref:PadR family transcriptional regulator n=1 Tax=Cohnella sp. LGH TaxID=1619153 RepID=UPI001AD97B3E|nr:PadR family transcriptional regulator [Cohnella sp. LGH]QTH43425.1 PadR family transcriptional regulator [Cohnella sp. LGH]